jgi:hypothetical protein
MLLPETPPAMSRRICSSEVEVRNCLEFSVGPLPPAAARPWPGGAVVGEQPFPQASQGHGKHDHVQGVKAQQGRLACSRRSSQAKPASMAKNHTVASATRPLRSSPPTRTEGRIAGRRRDLWL